MSADDVRREGHGSRSFGLTRTTRVAVLIGVATAAFRFISTVSYQNDHFVHLSRATQMLLGDLPVRDFEDPGMPLLYLVSAAGQWLGGWSLLPEVLIVCGAFGVAAGLATIVGTRMSGSLLVGAGVALLQVAAFPHTYSYPKVLLYVLAAWGALRYVERRDTRGLAALAAISAIAFLFRHDHGIYIAAACIVLALVVDIATPARALARAAAVGGLALLLVSPFLLFVQLHGGLGAYVRSGIAFSAAEAHLTRLIVPAVPGPGGWFGADAVPALFYLLVAIPVLALPISVWVRRPAAVAGAGPGLMLILLAAAADAGFLRDPLLGRLPDAVPMPTLVLAWMWGAVGVSAGPRSWLRAPLAVAWGVVLIATATSVYAVGGMHEQIDRADVLKGVGAAWRRGTIVVAELREPFNERQAPSDTVLALAPFLRYVQRCTPPDSRLFVPGFAPEIPYYAHRRFAGGHVTLFSDYYDSVRDQRKTASRIRGWETPFAVFPPGAERQVRQRFPIVWQAVEQQFVPFTSVPVEGQEPATIYISRAWRPEAVDAETGAPCGG